MAYSDINVFLGNFQAEVHELEKRYNQDPNHGILVGYIPMISRLKKIANIHLNPAIKELELLKMRYGDKYQGKDVNFHIQQALDNMAYIKGLLKDILGLYEEQTQYQKISEKWKNAFPSIERRIREVNSRLQLIEKILKDEL